MQAYASIITSISVDGRQGRIFGTTVEGMGNATQEAGYACAGGGKALGAAVNQGMGDAMRRLGEAISNSERVRAAAI